MALNIISNVQLDMKAPNTVIVYANQYDSAGSVRAQLLNSGESWAVPAGAKAVVMFKKSDKIGGFYDVTEFGVDAVEIDSDRSVIYINYDPQVLTTAGRVAVQINFYQNDQRLSSFAFYTDVQASAVTSGEIASSWLFNILSQEIAQTLTVATTPQAMTDWLEANITQETGYVIDNTLTVAGAASDAQATGKMVTVSNLNPNTVANKVWVKKTPAEIQIPTCEEVDELKSAFTANEVNLGDVLKTQSTLAIQLNYEQGSRIGDTPVATNTRIRAKEFCLFAPYKTLTFNISSGYKFELDYYDNNWNYIGRYGSGWLTNNVTLDVTQFTNAKRFSVLIANTENTVIDVEEGATALIITGTSVLYNAIDDTVRFSAQSKAEAEKAQARENIDAASKDDVLSAKQTMTRFVTTDTIISNGIVENTSGLISINIDKDAVVTISTPQLYDTASDQFNDKSRYIITLCSVKTGVTYYVTFDAKLVVGERIGIYTTTAPLNTDSLSGQVDSTELQYLIDGKMAFKIKATVDGYLVLRSPAHSISACVAGNIMVSANKAYDHQEYQIARYAMTQGDNSLENITSPKPIVLLNANVQLFDPDDTIYKDTSKKIITLCPVHSGEKYTVSINVSEPNGDRLGIYTVTAPLNANSLSGNVDSSGLQYATVGNMNFEVESTIEGYLVLRSPGFAIRAFGLTDILATDNSAVILKVDYAFDAKAAIETGTCAFVDSGMEKYETETEALAKKVREDVDSSTLVFAVTTDNHYNPNTERGRDQLVYAKDYVKLAERLGVDFALNLGDLIDQDDANATTVNPQRLFAITRIFANSEIPFVYAIGHHEQYPYLGLVNGVSNYTFSTDKAVGLTERFTRYLTDVHSTIDRTSASFYIDFEILGIRLISLDSVSNTPNGYSQAVVDFLQNEALNTTYKVLVVSHVASRASANWKAIVPVNGDLIEAALETFVSNGGTVLAHIHGHTHWDNIVKENDMSYPLISVCCAGVQKANTTTEAEGVSGAPTSYYRTNNSYSAYCMDVFCVHEKTGEIHIYRFGAGADRNYTPSD